jgi:hypothetical protein
MISARNHLRKVGGLALIGYTSYLANSTLLVTPNKPAGVVNGDQLIFFGGATTTQTWTGDTGWAEQIDQGAAPAIGVFTKIASSEGSSYSFGLSATTGAGGILLAFRGAALDNLGSIVTRTGNGTLTVTGFSSAGGVVLLFVHSADDAGQTISAPAGYTEIAAAAGMSSNMKVFMANVAAGTTASAASTIGTATGIVTGGIQFGIKNA